MKKKLLFGLCCAAMAIGCTTDPYQQDTPVVEGTPRIEISGRISQDYASRVDDGGFCQNDQVGLFGVNYTDGNTAAGTLLDEGNQVDNARYTFDEANNQWVSNGHFYYKDVNTNIDLYAYYPYAAVESVTEYKFEVAQDQSGANSVDGYAMSDFLWAKATNITPTENKIGLHFYHRMACADVTLKEGQGFESGEFEALNKVVIAMNTTRTSTIDLSTGVVTPTGEAESEGIVMKSGTEGFRAVVVPQSVEAGEALFTITIDGIAYRYKHKVLNELGEWTPAAFDYQAGKQSKFTITINKKKHSGEYEFVLTDTQVVDWIADIDTHAGEGRQYYVVHCEESGTLEAKIKADQKNPAKIKNLKVSGKIDVRDFYFMRDAMTILQSLNLKETEITPSWKNRIDDSYGGNRNVYFGGEMPATYDERKVIAQEIYPEAYIYETDFGSFPAHEIPEFVFQGKSTLVNFVFPEKVTKIGQNAFDGCALLAGALIVPDDVVEIGEFAFVGCSNITSLSLPPHLEKIGGGAFSGCSALSGNLGLPSSLTYIGSDAFWFCSGFTGPLVLPDNLEYLGTSAFGSCYGFTGDLVIPTSLTKISDGAFIGCTGLNGRLVLHDGITEINSGAFGDCSFQGELKLPANLLKIPTACFRSCQFSSIAEFPKGLIEIGIEAFWCNTRLMGTLEFPDELVALGDRAFTNCRNLEGVVLPAELAILKSGVFNECYYLNKIVCKAIEPPYVQSGAFDGVAKDNFAVEVPEQAINRYQNSSGWNEFKRIVAHHDFTISRRLMRTLNAEHTREFVLRAPSGFAWSVESMPDWVTVTPSSGIGKSEVTVTVSEMTAAEVGEFEINTGSYNDPQYERNSGRAGEIVFLLNGKDYRATMKIEQYDYQYGDGDVLVNQTATAVSQKKGVNLVFMGDCFDARDIARGSYLNGINEAIGHYFDIEPYKTYREYFNVYTVFGMSNDSGMGTVNTIRDAKFGSQYSLEGISPNIDTIIDYSFKTESVTKQNFNKSLVVMVENTTEYGGVTYMWSDGSAVAICPMSDDAFPYDFRGIVQHEAGGHGFAKLADEYIYHNAFIQSCGCICCPHLKDFNECKALGWYRNLEATGDMDQVGWSHFIFHPTYSNIVDVYEGGYFHTRGIFRSEPNSCMNNNIPYFSAISRQEAVERIMRYSAQRFSITDFYAKDVRDTYGDQVGTAALSSATDAISLTGAGKQMPPKYMGETPFK